MLVRDPKLAEQAVQIALSDEIPAQAASIRLSLISRLGNWHPLLGWNTFTEHNEMLMKPLSNFAPQTMARSVPEDFWNAVPLDEIEAWVKAHVSADMAPELARGMSAAYFKVALKKALVPATDTYVQTWSEKSKEAALKTGGTE
jgi:aminopeptidase N